MLLMPVMILLLLVLLLLLSLVRCTRIASSSSVVSVLICVTTATFFEPGFSRISFLTRQQPRHAVASRGCQPRGLPPQPGEPHPGLRFLAPPTTNPGRRQNSGGEIPRDDLKMICSDPTSSAQLALPARPGLTACLLLPVLLNRCDGPPYVHRACHGGHLGACKSHHLRAQLVDTRLHSSAHSSAARSHL